MRKASLFVLLYLMWCVFTWIPTATDLMLGAVAALAISFVFGDILYLDYATFLKPRRFFYLIGFILAFSYDCVRANIDVACRVLNPKLPMNPGIVKIKTSLKTDSAKAMLANSLSLIPGTLTVDICGEYLYVHWIDVKTKDVRAAGRIIAGRLERLLKEAFE